MTGRLGPPPVTEPDERAWMEHAECRGLDPAMFHPDRGDMETFRRAVEVCEDCPVRAECLDWALTVPEVFGVWGGRSEKARQKMRRGHRLVDIMRECRTCGAEFRPWRRDHVHCSARCRDAAKRAVAS